MSEIYTTLPERPVVDQAIRDMILVHLKLHPNEWHDVNTLCEVTGFEEKDKTKPTIRLACKELLHFDSEPIASCHAGFTYATHQGILQKFKENMQNRVQGMLRTLNDIDRVKEGLPSKESSPGFNDKCNGVYDDHLWDKAKDPWTCIRCKQTRRQP